MGLFNREEPSQEKDLEQARRVREAEESVSNLAHNNARDTGHLGYVNPMGTENFDRAVRRAKAEGKKLDKMHARSEKAAYKEHEERSKVRKVVAEFEPLDSGDRHERVLVAVDSFEKDETIPQWVRDKVGQYLRSYNDALGRGVLSGFKVTEKAFGEYEVEVFNVAANETRGHFERSNTKTFREDTEDKGVL